MSRLRIRVRIDSLMLLSWDTKTKHNPFQKWVIISICPFSTFYCISILSKILKLDTDLNKVQTVPLYYYEHIYVFPTITLLIVWFISTHTVKQLIMWVTVLLNTRLIIQDNWKARRIQCTMVVHWCMSSLQQRIEKKLPLDCRLLSHMLAAHVVCFESHVCRKAMGFRLYECIVSWTYPLWCWSDCLLLNKKYLPPKTAWCYIKHRHSIY